MMRIQSIFIIIYLFTKQVTFGHVGLIYPTGGETFIPNETITIQWEELISHGDNNWDLYFSTDGGNTWLTITTDLSKSILEYEWSVPEYETTTGRIKVIQDNIGSDYEASSGDFTISQTTNVKFQTFDTKEFYLYPAYPNPFNSSTVISFNLPEKGQVKLKLFNIAGEEIKTFINSEMEQGLHQFRMVADDISSGVYLYTIETKNALETRKIILLK